MQRCELIASGWKEVQKIYYKSHVSEARECCVRKKHLVPWWMFEHLCSYKSLIICKSAILTRSRGTDLRYSRTLMNALGPAKPVHTLANAARMTSSSAHWCTPTPLPAGKLLFCEKKHDKSGKLVLKFQLQNKKILTGRIWAFDRFVNLMNNQSRQT